MTVGGLVSFLPGRAAARSFAFAFAFAIAPLACTTAPKGTLTITLGGEADALVRAPAPVRLLAETVAADGTLTPLASVPLPAPGAVLGLPDLDVTLLTRVRVAALDAQDRVLLRGETLPVELGQLEGNDLPIFVQRTGEFARMPSPLPAVGNAPPVALVNGRYLLVAGAGDAGTGGSLYDLVRLQAYPFPAPLPRRAQSMAWAGGALLVIDETGASRVDLASFASVSVAAPAGLSFADVAGGRTIVADDGSAFIVGATRDTGPTRAVLRIAADGSLTAEALATPRAGAAAVWVPSRGLVILGGADRASVAAGLELIASAGAGAGAAAISSGGASPGADVDATATDAPTALPLAYPPLPGHGYGAYAPDGNTLVVVGGTQADGSPAPAVRIDLQCAAACAFASNAAPFPVSLARVSAFDLSADVTRQSPTHEPGADAWRALVLGTDPDGSTRAFRLDATSATFEEVSLREGSSTADAGGVSSPAAAAAASSRGASSAVRLPWGSIAVVGGAEVVEAYAP